MSERAGNETVNSFTYGAVARKYDEGIDLAEKSDD